MAKSLKAMPLPDKPKHYIKDENGSVIPVTFKKVTLELIDNVEKCMKADTQVELHQLQAATIAKLLPHVEKSEGDQEKQIAKAALTALEKGDITREDIERLNQLKSLAPANRVQNARQSVEIFTLCVEPTDDLLTDKQRLSTIELSYIERCVQDFLSYSGMN